MKCKFIFSTYKYTIISTLILNNPLTLISIYSANKIKNLEIMNTSKFSQLILCLAICISLITESQGAIFSIIQSGARGDGATDDSQVKNLSKFVEFTIWIFISKKIN